MKKTFNFKVPTLSGNKAAESLKDTILVSEPNAKVEIDNEAKRVTIEANASEETFTELIVAEGHEIE
jgi:copper chaperone